MIIALKKEIALSVFYSSLLKSHTNYDLNGIQSFYLVSLKHRDHLKTLFRWRAIEWMIIKNSFQKFND